MDVALRIRIETLGCRVNQFDSEAMRDRLGLLHDVDATDPDIVLINACTVTALAERKARQAARRVRRAHPQAIILLVGCLADAVGQGHAQFDDADLVAGNSWKPHIVELVDLARTGERGVLPARATSDLSQEQSSGPKTRIRALLKIQDGCGRACTYCRTTHVRGQPRSKALQSAVDEAKRLVETGFPEIALTGIDLAQYADGPHTLAHVVHAVSSVPGLKRLRLASINPSGITPHLLDVCRTQPVVCRHFHVPLQSGDNRILRAMQRGYDAKAYLRTVAEIRSALPDATFGTDLMVGFPGEDALAFAHTCEIVEEVGFCNVHVFRFSPRAGTPAADLPGRLPTAVLQQRANALVQLWEGTLARTLDNRIGSTHDLLVEEYREAAWRGYTRDYISVRLVSDRRIPIGSIVPVLVTGRSGEVLEGVDDHRTDAS